VTRESKELYQGGEEAAVGTYRDLASGEVARVFNNGDRLPEPPDRLATYAWISGDPEWETSLEGQTAHKGEHRMVVAEFSVTPLVSGDMRPYVDTAVEEIRKSGLKYEVDALSTTIEGELDVVLEAVKKAHQRVRSQGADRVVTDIKIDDCGCTMEQEVRGYR
jgi:uncharacterized protein (TIGR00106 family)